MRLRYLVGDRQAEVAASRFLGPGLVHAVKALEHPLALGKQDSRSGIIYSYYDRFPFAHG